MLEGGVALKKGLEEVFGGRRGGLEEDGGGPTDGGRPAGRGGVDGRTGLGAGRLVGLGGRKMLSMKDKKLGRSSWGEDRGEKGYLLMTSDWFKVSQVFFKDHHLYLCVVLSLIVLINKMRKSRSLSLRSLWTRSWCQRRSLRQVGRTNCPYLSI